MKNIDNTIEINNKCDIALNANKLGVVDNNADIEHNISKLDKINNNINTKLDRERPNRINNNANTELSTDGLDGTQFFNYMRSVIYYVHKIDFYLYMM